MTTLIESPDDKIAAEILRKQGALKQVLLEWLQLVELKIRLYRERQQLLVMSDLALQDIGVSRAEAIAEASCSDIPQQRIAALADGN